MQFDVAAHNRKITAVTFLVICAIFAATAHAQKIAAANPSMIFDSLQEIKDYVARMNNDNKAFDADRQSRALKLKDLQSQRDMFKPDSSQFSEADKKLADMSVESEVFVRSYAAKVERDRKRQYVKMFDKITAAIAKVAAAKGIDIVIADVRPIIPQQGTDQFEQINENALKGLISQRNVLYNSESLNITPAVVAQMDADYKAGK